MSKRQESVPYILVYDCPWWVSTLLAGVAYFFMKEVAPKLFQDNQVVGPIMQALPGVAWMAVTILLALSCFALLVQFLQPLRRQKRMNRSGKATPVARLNVSYDAVPDCPECDSPMVQRLAKRGENAGNHFWGCPHFPKCSGTRSL
jgi:hypothetical protein